MHYYVIPKEINGLPKGCIIRLEQVSPSTKTVIVFNSADGKKINITTAQMKSLMNEAMIPLEGTTWIRKKKTSDLAPKLII